jgi:hypothetical protein
VRLGVVEDAWQLVRRPEHLEAGHAHPLLAPVVVDETDWLRPQLRVAAQLERDRLAAVARSDDQDLAGVARRERPPRAMLKKGPHE